jgi:type II secretory pathway pseudopilin PulG
MKTRQTESGLTLVEVVISVGLLAFVSVGIMSLLIVSIRQNQLAQKRSVATALAAERIQQLTSLPYQASATYTLYKLPYEVAAAGPPATLTADYGAIPDYPGFRRVVTLTYDTPVAGMLRVQSSVFWQDLNQGVKSHEMITYLHPSLEQG